MQTELNNKQIIGFLKKTYKSAGFVDSLKIKYRSLICPFISLIKMVEPGQRVGDVGCGSGQFLLLVSEFAKPSYLYGIEISKKLIDNAKSLFSSRQQNSFFTEYDGTDFPVQLGEMDIIFLIDVLHHVPKKMQENFIKNLTNSMKPGATLVLKDINAASVLVFFNKLHDMIFAGEIGNEMSISKAAILLQANGLSIIKQEKRNMYVYPHYSIVAKK
jgi:2-polyprenyl-3-methyl-5-hydroxy-6-metoxy-1,4-benzoquinol methylase